MFLIPVGLRVVAIQHEETGFYIAMNTDGMIFTTVKKFGFFHNKYIIHICMIKKPAYTKPFGLFYRLDKCFFCYFLIHRILHPGKIDHIKNN